MVLLKFRNSYMISFGYLSALTLSLPIHQCLSLSPTSITSRSVKSFPTSTHNPIHFHPIFKPKFKRNFQIDASIPTSTPEYNESLNSSSTTTTTKSKSKSKRSKVAKWHADRRRAMIQRYPQIRELETTRSLHITLPLLIIANAGLTIGSIISGSLSLPAIFILAFTVGSMFSLWQLQILHECLHGSMLGSGTKLHRKLHTPLLFLGSLPSAFGYWLYLQYGHLTHHRSVGVHSLNDAFESDSMDLADGDVLFVNHRMDMKGEAGPQIYGKAISIGRFFYQFWKEGQHVRNAILFSMSFLIERCMLIYNDLVVALLGRNFFFPNKPQQFHNHVALYTRVGLLVRVTLCVLAGTMAMSTSGIVGDIGTTMSIPIPTFLTGLLAPAISTSVPMTASSLLSNFVSMTSFYWSWKPLLFLMLSETLWSLPPHPACAMFITNHGSKGDDDNCQPSGSTYAGKWYSIFTLGTNYHVEHHDFPTMPLHQLGKLRDITGPEFYGNGHEKDDLGEIITKAFAYPDFYACSNAGDLSDIQYAEDM